MPRIGLSNVVIVLDHPKDVVNIAAVIRVMNNFGLGTLRLVNPDEFNAYRIKGIAHRSGDLIEAATRHDSLEDAVADVSFVLGTTARPRTAGRKYLWPREAAARMAERAQDGTVAILLGREDRGLTNEGLDLCHAVSIIPTDSEYSSLNLAQACLVLAYEVFLALDTSDQDLPLGRRATRAPTQSGARADLRGNRARLEPHRVLQGQGASRGDAHAAHHHLPVRARSAGSPPTRRHRLRDRALL